MPLPPPPAKGILKSYEPPLIDSSFNPAQLASSKNEWLSQAKNAISSTFSRLKTKSINRKALTAANLNTQRPEQIASSDDTLVTASAEYTSSFNSNNGADDSFYSDLNNEKSFDADCLSPPPVPPKSIISEEFLVKKKVTFDEYPTWFEFETNGSDYGSEESDVEEVVVNTSPVPVPTVTVTSPQFSEPEDDDLILTDEKPKSIFNAISLIRRDTFSKKLRQRNKAFVQEKTSRANNNGSTALHISVSELTHAPSYSSLDSEQLITPTSITSTQSSIYIHEPLLKDPESITSQDVFLYYLQSCENRGQEPIEHVMRVYQDASELPSVLNLTGARVDANNILPLTDLLSLKIKIESLVLENTGLENESLKLMLYTLLNHTKIVHLSLADNKRISTVGFKYISVFVKKVSFPF